MAIKFIERLKHSWELGREIEKGLFIRPESRDTFIVTFQKRRIRVSSELLPKKGMIIYQAARERRTYFPPDEKNPLSEEQYDFVINATVNHFRKVGYKVELDRAPGRGGPPTVEELKEIFPRYQNPGYKFEKLPDGSIKVISPKTGLHKPVWWGIPFIIVIIIGLLIIMISNMR